MTWKKVLRVIRRESRKILISHRVVDQLSPHHDSQFSAFSTEVLDQMNRKHNRSSSPFTTLADRAERKVVSTGAEQPNYWPNTWFGADAYKAKLAMPKYAIKLFRLVGNSYVAISSPWQFLPRCVRETIEKQNSVLRKSECWIWIMFTGTWVICQSLFYR